MYMYIVRACNSHTDSSKKVPIVTELTLEMQGYRLIDSCGPQGISQAVSFL